jgi:hypothetical protein
MKQETCGFNGRIIGSSHGLGRGPVTHSSPLNPDGNVRIARNAYVDARVNGSYTASPDRTFPKDGSGRVSAVVRSWVYSRTIYSGG